MEAVWKLFRVGGWAPILVFGTHLIADRVFNAYGFWPAFDTPMHFCGGLAIAYFVSQCFQSLPRPEMPKSRVMLLELLLTVSVTTTAAVVWEFAEFMLDQLYGSNIQVSLQNTMKDLFLGVAGGCGWIVVRSIQLRAGIAEVRELVGDWVRGSHLTPPAGS